MRRRNQLFFILFYSSFTKICITCSDIICSFVLQEMLHKLIQFSVIFKTCRSQCPLQLFPGKIHIVTHRLQRTVIIPQLCIDNTVKHHGVFW